MILGGLCLRGYTPLSFCLRVRKWMILLEIAYRPHSRVRKYMTAKELPLGHIRLESFHGCVWFRRDRVEARVTRRDYNMRIFEVDLRVRVRVFHLTSGLD